MVTGSSLAVWRPIAGKHYNGRHGLNVTHIDLHIMCGTLGGSDSWFRRWNVRACSHYGIGKFGKIYQWIDEVNGSWADANRNADCGGITIEHEGGLKGIPCTQACIEASARLCADISRRYNLGKLWHDGLNGNVWLHREIPGTTHADCPDLAPNGLPYQQVIDMANSILETGDSDVVSDNDIQRIAEKVWQYNWQNTAIGGNQYNALNTAAGELAKAYDVCNDGTAGRIYERVAWVDKRVRDLWNGGIMGVLRKPNGACYLFTSSGPYDIPDPDCLSAIQYAYSALSGGRTLPMIQYDETNEKQIELIARIFNFRTDPADTDKPYTKEEKND